MTTTIMKIIHGKEQRNITVTGCILRMRQYRLLKEGTDGQPQIDQFAKQISQIIELHFAFQDTATKHHTNLGPILIRGAPLS